MNTFDHLKTSLDGCKLIESSAGTGKTYAIASLFVRLLLEHRVEIHKILVVTFTEAATAELQDRIRRKLKATAHALECGTAGEDAFLQGLVSSIPDKALALSLLREALYSFDQAAIFTIHGFCQKVLQENAFETASPFNTSLLADQSTLYQEIVDDFWRKHFYNTSPVLVQGAVSERLLDTLTKLAPTTSSNPFLKIIPEDLKPDLQSLEPFIDRAEKLLGRVKEVWTRDGVKVKELLINNDGLNKRKYGPATVLKMLEELRQYFASGFVLPRPDCLNKLSTPHLLNATNKGKSPPQHHFFDACEEFLSAQNALSATLKSFFLAVRCDFIRFAREELAMRKRRRNARSYDDLLLDLYAVLQKPAGRRLIASLRNRFKAALIDEFQDTDPVQYAIFRSIFGTEASLFLIGDPKQAIYGFRGADIFTYMTAKKDVVDQYTLSKNWRSESRLVTAVNGIFSYSPAGRPFVFPEIGYIRSQSALDAKAGGFVREGRRDTSPLKIWFLNRDDEVSVTAISKNKAEEILPDAVASEIVRLLNAGREGRVLIDGRAISPWDIAILVRKHWQADVMQKALRRRCVPSVAYGAGSVFETKQATELRRLLTAISEPGNEGRLKAALATELLGMSGEKLAGLAENDTEWDEWLNRFADYRNLWMEKGFIPMIRTLLIAENVRGRLLSLADGERRLTNLQHCIELLQEAAVQEHLGIEGVLKWLSLRMQRREEDSQDEQKMRLETDEKALKVITVHKSKGLEYPVVFCPYVWDAHDATADEATFHDEQDRGQLVKDLGSEDLLNHKVIEQREILAEQCRLFYVAITRAKYRCYICWGNINKAEKSAPAYLLHGPESATAEDAVLTAQASFRGMTDKQMVTDLKKLVRQSEESIELLSVPEATEETCRPLSSDAEIYSARNFMGDISSDWGMASFSRISAGESHRTDIPDYDPLHIAPGTRVEPAAADAASILEFPKGTQAGTLLHEIFEELDFAAAESPLLHELVQRKLEAHGFDKAWQNAVCLMIRNVLSAPLRCEEQEIVLSRLSNQQILREMEFTFPLARITPHRLAGFFSAYRTAAVPDSLRETLASLQFKAVRGFMKGFIDLIFQWGSRYYLLDWKSNYLGPSIENYDQPSMIRVMESHLYTLQYHLYTIALHRFLTFRMPAYDYEKHFGGVFYIFLRGVESERSSDCGIFTDRPPAALIADLSARLSSEDLLP